MKKNNFFSLILSVFVLILFFSFISIVFGKLNNVIDELFESTETIAENNETEIIEDQTQDFENDNIEKCIVDVKMTKYDYVEDSVPSYFVKSESSKSKFEVNKGSVFNYEFPILTEYSSDASPKIWYPMYDTKISPKINFDVILDVLYYQADLQFDIEEKTLSNGNFYIDPYSIDNYKCVVLISKLDYDLDKVCFSYPIHTSIVRLKLL